MTIDLWEASHCDRASYDKFVNEASFDKNPGQEPALSIKKENAEF